MSALMGMYGGKLLILFDEKISPGWHELNGVYDGEIRFRGKSESSPQLETSDASLRVTSSLQLSTGVCISGTMCFGDAGVQFEDPEPNVKIIDRQVILKQGVCVPWDVLFGPDLEKLIHTLVDTYSQ
ncbi:hypothetical protein [Shimazuella kribbensis]|uniref:hypothetical protein n=1 Tax=Shimazuella kribbensis TaxID=139808 RepID=UPI00048DE070|nr:hypothetical protein [Shimazuella kribbensis]